MGFRDTLRRRIRAAYGRDVESRMGGILLFGGALVTLSGVLLPHSEQAYIEGYLLLSIVLAGCGLLVGMLPRALAQRASLFTAGIGILACTASLLLNGESRGGPPMLNEFFYIWPVLYAGFFFSTRLLVATLTSIAALYATSLSLMGIPLEEATIRLLVTFSVLAGVALAMRALKLHIDRLVSKLNKLARTDPLTGLLNRRAFDERLKLELERTHRTAEPFALLLGDIDHFKALNDEHGHEAGDQALTWVSDALKRESRAIDTVARIGGEEFALILPASDLQNGFETAERLRHTIRTSTGANPLTTCFGVVEGPRHGLLPDDLLRTADRALYAAKAAGRNRTHTPEAPTAPPPRSGTARPGLVS